MLEFLGRVDEIVVFNQLTEQDFVSIAALMLGELKEPLAEKGITLLAEVAGTGAAGKEGTRQAGRRQRFAPTDPQRGGGQDLFLYWWNATSVSRQASASV